MGHFGRRSIRTAWLAVAMPALLINYFGQGALLLADPASIENPFYWLAPDMLPFRFQVHSVVHHSQGAVAGIKAGLAALQAGQSEAASALPSNELRTLLGYGDYDAQAKQFIVG